MTEWTRGDLAEHTGVSKETLRYYEKRGLIPPPSRSSAGYRLYDKGYARRIEFIKRAKELGFTLEEIIELFSLRAGDEYSCEEVKNQAEAKIAEVRSKIVDLKQIEGALSRLTYRCSGTGPTSECPILDVMEKDVE